MERLTIDGNFCEISVCATGGQECTPLAVCKKREIWDRLKAIEDILGDNYELEELKQRWGYMGMIGKTVFGIRHRYTTKTRKGAQKTYDRSVGSPCILKKYPNECYVAERICVRSDLAKLGSTVFLTLEEAEAAIGGADHA